MTGLHIALVIVSLVAACLIVALIWEETNRREWKRHDAVLERRVAVDEYLISELRGPRHRTDIDDPTRRR